MANPKVVLVRGVGDLRDCKTFSAGSQKEAELLRTSKIGAEILSALATWTFTPATFDGRTCEFEFVPRFKFILPR
jgi:hypothetical protein